MDKDTYTHGSRMTKAKLIALIMALFAILLLTVGKHVSDNHSRSHAQAAANSYIPKAKKYLTDMGNGLIYEGNPTTTGNAAASQATTLHKIQSTKPDLQKVSGAGSKSQAYQTALSYEHKVDGVQSKLSNTLSANDEFSAYITAYTSIYNVQTAIANGALSQGDPTTALQNTIVNPLTASQTEFKKIKVSSTYQKFNTDLLTAYTSYLTAANNLIAMYKSGNLNTVSYDNSSALSAAYIDSRPIAASVNNQLTTLGNTLVRLAK